MGSEMCIRDSDLIAQGRVEVAGRRVYIDGKEMPPYGYRIGE